MIWKPVKLHASTGRYCTPNACSPGMLIHAKPDNFFHHRLLIVYTSLHVLPGKCQCRIRILQKEFYSLTIVKCSKTFMSLGRANAPHHKSKWWVYKLLMIFLYSRKLPLTYFSTCGTEINMIIIRVGKCRLSQYAASSLLMYNRKWVRIWKTFCCSNWHIIGRKLTKINCHGKCVLKLTSRLIDAY